MKVKKYLSTLILILGIIFMILFTKYGWKYMGFTMVTDPKFVIAQVEEENNEIVIKGTTALSVGTYEGYYSEVVGDTLYFGVHFSLLGDEGSFVIKHKENGPVRINRVVIKKEKIEKEIWRR